MMRRSHRRHPGFECAAMVLISAILVLAAVSTIQAAVATDDLNRRCLGCHDDYRYRSRFFESVHGQNGCISCHAGITNFSRHASGQEKVPEVTCGKCHAEISKAFLTNVHYLNQDFRCYDCHRDIHALKAEKTGSKSNVIRECTSCHSRDTYVAFGHGEKVLKGNRDSAGCSDCHGVHSIPRFQKEGEKASAPERAWYSGKCISCHDKAQMMKRNGVSATAVRDYEQTYHGKVSKAGYGAKVAGCSDCHTSHNILPAADPRSVVHTSNLIYTCGKCHEGFHARFVKFKAHPDYGDRKRYPALFWTAIFMEGLLISVFAFFWIHTGLWWRKAFWEKCQRDEQGETLTPQCESAQVRRFPVLYRIMHFLLILSFFTLVLTGLPLKYFGTDWARSFFGILGGVETAGLLHRIAASILSALFLYTLWLTLRFLFPGGIRDLASRRWIERLFGPDSLFPNLKDFQDIKGMFLWFFNKGEAPRFDRWTYWEKFDFLAVFWGMAAIGGSGLILWFPETFSYTFPGWIINVATIIHSEEALLAALFIFTVHFFNNHLLPDKFPMEPNIFTGRNGINQLKRERPLEYERLVHEGKLESIFEKPPGNFARLIYSVFGMASLALGLLLVLMIVWTILML